VIGSSIDDFVVIGVDPAVNSTFASSVLKRSPMIRLAARCFRITRMEDVGVDF